MKSWRAPHFDPHDTHQDPNIKYVIVGVFRRGKKRVPMTITTSLTPRDAYDQGQRAHRTREGHRRRDIDLPTDLVTEVHAHQSLTIVTGTISEQGTVVARFTTPARELAAHDD